MAILESDELKEKQYQLDYCIYMMATSYFHKAVLDDDRWMKRLYLSYQSLKNDKQVKLEEKVIYAIEHYMLMKIPKAESMDIHVKLKKYKEQTAIHLYNKNFHCVLLGYYLDDYCTKIKLDIRFPEEIRKEKEHKNAGQWVEIS